MHVPYLWQNNYLRVKKVTIKQFAGQQVKKPIVNSSYVEWASSMFARAEEGGGGGGGGADCESRQHHERAWRYARNRSLRNEAAGTHTLTHLLYVYTLIREVKLQ